MSLISNVLQTLSLTAMSETLRRTGNAKNIDSWRYYVHICVYEGGTNSEDKVDPIDYFNTKFDRNGNEIND